MSINGVSGEVATSGANAEQQKQTDKELNFAKLREKNERAERELEAQRQETIRLAQEVDRLKQRYSSHVEEEDDDDSEPYVETKKLKKILAKVDEKIERAAEEKAARIFEQKMKQDYMFRLKSEYKDFDEVLNQETIDKLAEAHPSLTNQIMKIGDEYERRVTAYETIKGMGLHKKAEASPIQEKINQNMRNLYHVPSATGNPPAAVGDFSQAGKKNAYENMQKLMRQHPGMPR